jgi:hypothetical protein
MSSTVVVLAYHRICGCDEPSDAEAFFVIAGAELLELASSCLVQ